MNAASAREPWEGRVVEGKYSLLEMVGSSPQGSVFRTRLGAEGGSETAAIKLIPVESTDVESTDIDAHLSRLRQAMALSHPNLIRILDVGHCQIQRSPAIYIVTEYADENLAQVLPTRPLTLREVEDTLRPLVDVLEFIHGRGFVHGRVKPSNILAAGNELKLSSDCIHKLDDPAARILSPSAYDAPEVAIGAVTPAADVWSLGATLVAALTQHAPTGKFDDKVESVVPSSIPEPFRRIAQGCLQSSASERCTLGQIKQWLNAKPVGPSLVTAAVQPPVTRNRFKTIGIPLLALTAILAFVWISRTGKPTLTKQPDTTDHTVISAPSRSAPQTETGAQKGTAPGSVAERVLPTVPQSARNTVHGKIRVSVRVNVNSSGEVSAARLSSPGPSKYFANLALQASRGWKFKPPEVDGQPVASSWNLQFQFGRTGTEVNPTPIR